MSLEIDDFEDCTDCGVEMAPGECQHYHHGWPYCDSCYGKLVGVEVTQRDKPPEKPHA